MLKGGGYKTGTCDYQGHPVPLLGTKLIKIRKYIPFIGGMDFSPVIVILLLSFIRNLLIDYRLSL